MKGITYHKNIKLKKIKGAGGLFVISQKFQS